MANYSKLKELVGKSKMNIEKTQIDDEGNSETFSFGDQRNTGLFGKSEDGVTITDKGNGRIFSDDKLENENLYNKISSNIDRNLNDQV